MLPVDTGNEHQPCKARTATRNSPGQRPAASQSLETFTEDHVHPTAQLWNVKTFYCTITVCHQDGSTHQHYFLTKHDCRLAKASSVALTGTGTTSKMRGQYLPVMNSRCRWWSQAMPAAALRAGAAA